MPLTVCPDCSNAVSPRAEACPRCGAPIANRTVHTPVHVQEKTAKQFKAQMALGGVAMAVGAVFFFVAMSNASPGATFASLIFSVAGLVIYVSARIRAWWHHG